MSEVDNNTAGEGRYYREAIDGLPVLHTKGPDLGELVAAKVAENEAALEQEKLKAEVIADLEKPTTKPKTLAEREAEEAERKRLNAIKAMENGANAPGHDWDEDVESEEWGENRCLHCNTFFHGTKRRLVCMQCHRPQGILLEQIDLDRMVTWTTNFNQRLVEAGRRMIEGYNTQIDKLTEALKTVWDNPAQAPNFIKTVPAGAMRQAMQRLLDEHTRAKLGGDMKSLLFAQRTAAAKPKSKRTFRRRKH